MMKKYKKVFFLFLMSLFVIVSSCKYGRYVYFNFLDINDYKIFYSRPLKNDSVQFVFHASKTNKIPEALLSECKSELELDQYLERNNTVAFLVIKNDTVRYEKYYHGYDQASIVPSFSMSKPIVSILTGCAIDDGLIGSVEDAVVTYLPGMKGEGWEKLKIKHLLQMSSGLNLKEGSISPFGDAAKLYYGRNIPDVLKNVKVVKEPGTQFRYLNGNTQLLALILSKVLKEKTLTQYLQEKLWQPLGMEYDASWSIDKKQKGIEKAFCCINARARDYAKIGRLYLNQGNWNGKQIVSKEWVLESTKMDSADGSPWYYQYQWWIPSKNGDFMASGMLGQFIYVNPDKKLVVVRLGKSPGKIEWAKFFVKVAEKY